MFGFDGYRKQEPKFDEAGEAARLRAKPNYGTYHLYRFYGILLGDSLYSDHVFWQELERTWVRSEHATRTGA